MQKTVQETMLVWPEAPRFCLHRHFPSYRFIPGHSPHPRQNPQGHSYGRPDEKPASLPPERWSENEFYLHGIDLYHQGYLWESHEAWESLWHLTGKEDIEGQFLQGLIQNAAALLKVALGQWEGAGHLSREAHRRLLFVLHSGVESFMGLNVRAFVADVERYYAPVWTGQQTTDGAPPRMAVTK